MLVAMSETQPGPMVQIAAEDDVGYSERYDRIEDDDEAELARVTAELAALFQEGEGVRVGA